MCRVCALENSSSYRFLYLYLFPWNIVTVTLCFKALFNTVTILRLLDFEGGVYKGWHTHISSSQPVCMLTHVWCACAEEVWNDHVLAQKCCVITYILYIVNFEGNFKGDPSGSPIENDRTAINDQNYTCIVFELEIPWGSLIFLASTQWLYLAHSWWRTLVCVEASHMNDFVPL